MGSPNEFDRELLSAYLDDALDQAERLQVERLLAANPSAGEYLDQLRAARQAFSALAHSTTGGSGPGPGFAQRVIAAARAQAALEGLASDHHVLRAAAVDRRGPEAGTIEPLIARGRDEKRSGARRSLGLRWTGLAALAASLALVALIPILRTTGIQSIANLPAPPTDIGSNDINIGTDQTEVGSNLAADAPEAVDVAVNDSATSTDRKAMPSGTVNVARGADRPNELHERRDLPTSELLLTFDVVMSDEAWETGRFDALLDKVGIPLSGTVQAERALLETLRDSQSIVTAPAPADAQVALVYLNSQGQLIDNLIVAIESDKRSFIDFRFGLAVGDLSKALQKYAPPVDTNGRGSARLIVVDKEAAGDGVVPSFAAPQHELDPTAQPGVGLGRMANFGLGNLPAEVLVVLRKQ